MNVTKYNDKRRVTNIVYRSPDSRILYRVRIVLCAKMKYKVLELVNIGLTFILYPVECICLSLKQMV